MTTTNDEDIVLFNDCQLINIDATAARKKSKCLSCGAPTMMLKSPKPKLPSRKKAKPKPKK